MYRRGSALLLATAFVASAAGCVGTVRLHQTMSPAVGDLTAIKLVELVDDKGQVLMRGTFEAAPGNTDKVERVAELTRPANNTPVGEAEIELERTNGVSEEEFLIKAEDLPYPASLRVMVDGLEIAQFSTTQDGKIDLRVWRRVTSDAGIGS
jgi:hypothetical protein